MKHILVQTIILCNWYQRLSFSLTNHINKKKIIIPKGFLFKKVFPKGYYSEICNFLLTYDLFGVKSVGNNDEPSEYRPTYMSFEGKLSKLLARLLLVLLIYV